MSWVQESGSASFTENILLYYMYHVEIFMCFMVNAMTNEPPHDKTNKIACTIITIRNKNRPFLCNSYCVRVCFELSGVSCHCVSCPIVVSCLAL